MSLVGAVMMLWVIDGLVQLLTGYSVFGNPLIELDSGQALVTGVCARDMALPRDFVALLPGALRRTGGGRSCILALPLFAAIVMSGNEASMVHALAALAGYALSSAGWSQTRQSPHGCCVCSFHSPLPCWRDHAGRYLVSLW